jgi:hypothetical protein
MERRDAVLRAVRDHPISQRRVCVLIPSRTCTHGNPLHLAFYWAHGRRKLIAAKPKKGAPIVDEALLRIAALYKAEDAIRGTEPKRRRTVAETESSRCLGRRRLFTMRCGKPSFT